MSKLDDYLASADYDVLHAKLAEDWDKAPTMQQMKDRDRDWAITRAQAMLGTESMGSEQDAELMVATMNPNSPLMLCEEGEKGRCVTCHGRRADYFALMDLFEEKFGRPLTERTPTDAEHSKAAMELANRTLYGA